MNNRQQFWFERGRRDALAGEWLSFDNAPVKWTYEEEREAMAAYMAGYDSLEVTQ